jgi:hypothetical protein
MLQEKKTEVKMDGARPSPPIVGNRARLSGVAKMFQFGSTGPIFENRAIANSIPVHTS